MGSSVNSKSPALTGLPRKVKMNGNRNASVAIKYRTREVEMYSLTKNEILALRSSDGALDSSLASAAASGFITSLVTLLTVEMNPTIHASFIAAAIATGFFTIFFGVRTILTRRSAEKIWGGMFESENSVIPIHRRPGA